MMRLGTHAIACLLVFVCHGSVLAQERTGLAPPFNPREQRAITEEKDGTRVTLLKNEPCATCTSGSRVILEMTAGRGAAPRRLVLDGPAQVDDLYVVDATRALLVGQAQSAVSEVVVIDPRSVRVVDRFLCLQPVISPDRTRIAYVKVFPLHFVEGVSAQYLVYDVTLPPSALRHPTVPVPEDLNSAPVPARVNVGVPVYPPDSENTPHDNYRLPEGSQHSLRSAFFWSQDSRRVAFSDWVNASQWLVVADLSAGLREAVTRSHRLDTDAIVNRDCKEYAGREADAFTVSDVDFLSADGTIVRLAFQFRACGGIRGLTVDVR
jgi:hypothetical protein